MHVEILFLNFKHPILKNLILSIIYYNKLYIVSNYLLIVQRKNIIFFFIQNNLEA